MKSMWFDGFSQPSSVVKNHQQIKGKLDGYFIDFWRDSGDKFGVFLIDFGRKNTSKNISKKLINLLINFAWIFGTFWTNFGYI